MAEYDGLPLNTPTMIGAQGDCDIWATRTANGGTVEHRVRSGTDTDRAQQLQARMVQAIAANTTYIALAAPSTAQNTAQIKALTRQVQAMLRLAQGQLAAVD